MTSITSSTTRQGNLFVAGALATVAAIIGNVIIFYIAAAIQGGPLMVPDPRQPAGGVLAPAIIFAPILLTAIGTIGATLVYGLVRRRSKQPARTFTIISLVVLLLSYLPLGLPLGLPIGTSLAFGIMHIVAAVIAVPILLIIGK